MRIALLCKSHLQFLHERVSIQALPKYGPDNLHLKLSEFDLIL